MAFVMPKTVFASGTTGCTKKRDALYILSMISSGYSIEDNFRGGHSFAIKYVFYNQRALKCLFSTWKADDSVNESGGIQQGIQRRF